KATLLLVVPIPKIMSLATRKKVETIRMIRSVATAVVGKVKVRTVNGFGIEEILDREVEKNGVGTLLEGVLTSVNEGGKGADGCEEKKQESYANRYHLFVVFLLRMEKVCYRIDCHCEVVC